MKTMTPMKAIRAMCIECSGGQMKQVRECNLVECPLFPYRMGKRPKDDTNINNDEL